MNTFYGISFAIYFILITLVLTTFIYGLKRDKYNGRFPRLVFVLRRFKEMENGVVLLRLWQVPMGMDILLPVLTVYMILWNKL